ncbi:rhomboid family intramembrane serine protease [Nonlabens agnitus]|uniref:Rhomboid family intramembrane serine protease n=1 Tax=Nonlabens agnitus TaxID=870484 RepID=A0A2S9WQF0_9FLAO|nr:rhomboid family intramembrane serine protease [Nonlabens agnitus]PRP65717.1 rhomboid family intramembrane serine protease [Nonlabens agnitus]
MNNNVSTFEMKWLMKPILFVFLMWFAFWIEMRFHTDFTKYGLRPRTLEGILGVFTSPFIHSGFSHLWSNTAPIAVLLFFLSLFYYNWSSKVLIYGILMSGILTWLIGRDSYHIGASGIVYFLASFIFFKGIFLNNYRQIAASLIVVFLYGSLVWYMLPIKPNMSWEGHLSGAVAGLILAIFLKVSIPKEKPFAKANQKVLSDEEDWFLQQFDEDGNFSPIPVDEEE